MSIISIQSHVAYGYVGNKAAVFPLQSMGHDVWPINTVQFSNHTGYGKWQGTVFTREQIKNIVQGLEDLGVTSKCQAVLSGYMGSADICHEVLEIVKRFKSKDANVLYLCDPVIGKNNCFVKPEVLSFFQDHLCTDIVTPSQFEAETFSGIKVKSVCDLKNISAYFHDRGVQITVITGVKFGTGGSGVFISCDGAYYLVEIKEYDFVVTPNGAGDLFSALFLGNFLRTRDGLNALRLAVYFVEKVMKNTFEAGSRELLVTSVNYSDFDEPSLPNCVNL